MKNASIKWSWDALCTVSNYPVPEIIDPRFRENKPKTLVFSH